MASIRRRGKKWRVELYHQGKRLSKTFPSKAECERWATQRQYELNHNIHHPSTKKTVGQALSRYSDEYVVLKKGKKRETLFINKLLTYPIADMLLENANTAEWAKWRDTRLREVQAATVRRELTIVKAMYRVAVNEWLWVRGSPLTNLSQPKAPPPRDRRVWPEEEAEILKVFGFKSLCTPKLIKDYVILTWLFALETAMRSGEILRLTWHHVYLNERYVHIPDSKNGTKRDVPLSRKAVEILKILPRDNKTCFKLNDKQRDSNFRKYFKKTGIKDMTFHDTRHEAITRLAKKIEILDLSRVTGIKDLKTLMVYYNETASEIAKKLD